MPNGNLSLFEKLDRIRQGEGHQRGGSMYSLVLTKNDVALLDKLVGKKLKKAEEAQNLWRDYDDQQLANEPQ